MFGHKSNIFRRFLLLSKFQGIGEVASNGNLGPVAVRGILTRLVGTCCKDGIVVGAWKKGVVQKGVVAFAG